MPILRIWVDVRLVWYDDALVSYVWYDDALASYVWYDDAVVSHVWYDDAVVSHVWYDDALVAYEVQTLVLHTIRFCTSLSFHIGAVSLWRISCRWYTP